VDSRTWRSALYVLIYLPLGVAAGYLLLLLLAAGTFLSLTFLGLPLIALVLTCWRQFGRLHRRLADVLLGERIAAPHPLRPASGRLDRIGRRLGDVVAWRAVAYQIIKVPQSILAAAVCLAPLAFGLWSATYPIWWSLVPNNSGRHKHGFPIDGFYFDTWPRAFLICIAGLLVLAAWPWLLRGVLVLDRLLARGLLGPVRMTQRVSDLEQSRALAVEDAAATVRKIERDLHDGAQARLVSLAMSLTLVQDTLRRDDVDLTRARTLVDTAHQGAKEAIAELRDLVRGIHPPVLDQGLEPALRTLAARSTPPAMVRFDLPTRPSPAIETIGYFCAAELLTNATRHSSAKHIDLAAKMTGGLLVLRIVDDGDGGADPAGGTGLAGLRARVRTVDGRLHVDSPPGGPTIVTVALPAHPAGG
jgi:signal transduction histidine kinase